MSSRLTLPLSTNFVRLLRSFEKLNTYFIIFLSVSKMACVICRTKTDRKCLVCNTPYCSEGCQDLGHKDHMIFCYPLLHQRIKSCLDYAMTLRGDFEYNLSGSYLWSQCQLIPFGRIGGLSCAVCSEVLGLPRSQHRVRYLNNSNKRYHVCDKCSEKRLCPITLAETGLCFIRYGALNWLTFLLCLKYLKVRMPRDIKRLILKDVGTCQHVEKSND